MSSYLTATWTFCMSLLGQATSTMIKLEHSSTYSVYLGRITTLHCCFSQNLSRISPLIKPGSLEQKRFTNTSHNSILHDADFFHQTKESVATWMLQFIALEIFI